MDWTDQQTLTQQYSSDEKLAIRIRTQRLYAEPKVHFPVWALQQIEWRGDELVIDVGCGTGQFLPPALANTATVIAGDLSEGMVGALNVAVPGMVLDAQALPFATDSADILLANYMLYHVADSDRAIAELARVLKPGGALLAATNSGQTNNGFDVLKRNVSAELGFANRIQPAPPLSFTLENGAAQLQRHFSQVALRRLPTAYVFPEPQPVIDFLATMRERWMSHAPANTSWSTISTTIRRQLSSHIAQHGSYRVEQASGVFICRNA